MKLHLSPADIKRVEHLIDVKDTNIQVADMYLYYLLEEPLYITNKLKGLKEKPKSSTDVFFSHLMECLSVDLSDHQNQILARRYFSSGIKQLDPTPFVNNPFYQLIHPVATHKGNWSIKYRKYEPYQGFAYDDIIVNEDDYREITPMGFFDVPYPYLSIHEKSKLWMSLIPHEMMTMQAPLEQMSGSIVVFGLGLGYFTLMAALKKEVTRVTVIEKSKAVISLFKSTILPSCPHQEKITIVEADAFEYLAHMPTHFDMAFVDIWIGVNDGLSSYMIFKSFEHHYRTTHFTYWLEKSLLAYLRRMNLIYIQEILEGFDDSHYTKDTTIEDAVINGIHQLLEGKTFTDYEQIHELLSDKSLLSQSVMLGEYLNKKNLF